MKSQTQNLVIYVIYTKKKLSGKDAGINDYNIRNTKSTTKSN